ncbi:FtsW/RodA/SpoVE family cell cycle protein [Flaviaesturariibacter flavus]|uniref:FtsW/RodA/SpoVE family cell cycle protein n=1 Tax=Flaviaesturariibacter flavus TaxID=2502780 RepID=UPI001A9FFE7A|nr:FtsW/RodA/SpoVE family cell cycle protein [Flaviaesturariibacter flavus]
MTKRRTERVLLLAIALVLGGLFALLYRKQEADFAAVPQRLSEGTMVNLNADPNGEALARLLLDQYYFEDPRDVRLIKEAVASGRQSVTELDNTGALNKRPFLVPAGDALARGGTALQKRARLANRLIGFDGPDSMRYLQEKKAPPPLPAVQQLAMGRGALAGTIRDAAGLPAAGVLVRLERVLPQDSSAGTDAEAAVDLLKDGLRYRRAPGAQPVWVAAYARTDASGNWRFEGLAEGAAYEVLPLQPGYTFGPVKGVAELKGTARRAFTRSPLTLRLFSGRDFNLLKREGALIVRTPDEARTWFWVIGVGILVIFLLLHLFLSARLPGTDPFLLPLLMLLTGLSFLTLLSLQDPLRDRFLARSTFWYFLAGMVGVFVVLLFNMARFTPDAGAYRMFAVKGRKGERGLQWGLAALALLVATIIFGSGPEGSGVKVNLFGFQPSESIRFLIVLFLAGFFAANERLISEYATARRRWSFFYPALAAVAGTILLFLMLGDLGPALVVCFTFIVLFSFSRGDFWIMAATVALFVLANLVIGNPLIATGVTVVLLSVYLRFFYKRLSESSVIALTVLAGFLLLDQVPMLDRLFPGPVQRLVDRRAIWQNPWDNEVFGGDQIANGIWGMASGGASGQGIGEGFAKTIPEAHTDMILPAIGEELGWAGVVCLFLLFLVYLHRALLIGRATGRPFLFYLCAGIGISTFIQFLLIAGGSTGALPLSGITLPFISYGGSSLIINLVAAGFLLSASFVRGSEAQLDYVRRRQDHNLVPAMAVALLGIVALSVNLGRYLFQPARWVVQPALVADRSGARMFSYNPRIAILMNRLEAGALYDREHRLVATSRSEHLLRQRDTLLSGGVTPGALTRLSRRRLDRYYPYGDELFFWTGDANTGVFTGSLNGWFGEYRMAAELRGFSTPETTYEVRAHHYRESRFLPPSERDMTVVGRDYSALAPLLLAGIDSKEVESFKQRNRDVQLSIDAALQTALQRGLAASDSLRDNRVSIVVLSDRSGDVLASACWPLPPTEDWEALTMTPREAARQPWLLTLRDLGFSHATQPGSTAKLATALAGLNKYGPELAEKKLLIRPQDLIRVRSAEPDEPGMIGMERAIVKSNNSYFIKLANEMKLQEEMATIYLQTGMFWRGVGGYFYERPINNGAREESWRDLWRRTEFTSLRRYNPNDIRRTRGQGVSGAAWGQGELTATPAAVARLAAGIANGGALVPHRIVLKIADSTLPVKNAEPIAHTPQLAQLLTGFMKAQSAGKRGILGLTVAGKTGTPERILRGQRINDGWYVFFAPASRGDGNIVCCIRIEATKGSSDAVQLAGRLVIPELLRRGYVRSFPGAGATDSMIRIRPLPPNE